ncbi:MAG TPA: hypothetical protein VFR65_02570 [Nitrososphaeraceae archaeon]|jgi:hypothetical protein|nr:hypothetical protein [Nitrososphaeraceae archaeon]
MSLFANPSQNLKNAINWFNALRKEEQVSILTNLEENPEDLTTEQNEQLTIIALEIAGAIPYGQNPIIKKFIELGLPQVHASLIVNAITTKSVLPKLDAMKLLSLDDQQYEKAIESVIVKLFIENNPINKIQEYSGLDNQILGASLRFIRDNILFLYLRGEMTIDNLKKVLHDQLNFPENRIYILVNILEQNKETIWKNFVFRNTQETFFKMQVLERNQIELISQIQQLIQLLKGNKEGSSQEQRPAHIA